MANVFSNGFESLTVKLESWVTTSIEMLPNLLIAAVVMIAFVLLGRLVFRWIVLGLAKAHLNRNLTQLLANVCRLTIYCLGLVTVLGILDLQKTVFSLLAGVGVIGLALGFAFRDLAANFIAGVMLAVRSPIRIGDVIEIGKTNGTVSDIRLRDTIVRSSDGQDIFIPNKDFTSNQFTNFSSSGKRRVRVDVGIGFECNPSEALGIVARTLLTVDGVLSDQTPEAYVDKLDASTVNLIGYVWIKYPGTNFSKVKSEATLQIKTALEAANVSLPSPILQIEIRPEGISQFLQAKPTPNN
ncbi:hypothetical protein BH10BDE1_BH10BDE1_17890 [soil metagenome]